MSIELKKVFTLLLPFKSTFFFSPCKMNCWASCVSIGQNRIARQIFQMYHRIEILQIAIVQIKDKGHGYISFHSHVMYRHLNPRNGPRNSPNIVSPPKGQKYPNKGNHVRLSKKNPLTCHMDRVKTGWWMEALSFSFFGFISIMFGSKDNIFYFHIIKCSMIHFLSPLLLLHFSIFVLKMDFSYFWNILPRPW